MPSLRTILTTGIIALAFVAIAARVPMLNQVVFPPRA